MTPARLEYSLDDQAYPVVLREDVSLWCIQVRAGWYQLGENPDLATRFLRERVRTAGGESPALIASRRFPLVLSIDETVVRAWPAMVPRNRPEWSKTYINPATGRRVLATKGPYWIFATPGRQHSACGTASLEQTVDDVIDLAQLWLRTRDG